METTERLLRVWLEDQSQRIVPPSVTIIQEKAKSLMPYSVNKVKALKQKNSGQVKSGL